MKLSELMAGKTPSPDFEGWATNDDWVLAVDVADTPSAKDGDFVVAQTGITGLDAQMNPVTQDKQYIRAGTSTQKTGTQRSFAVTGDRYIGDAFQDWCFRHDIKYGVGQKVIKPYVYFNMLNGKGEKGTVSVIVNSDSSGNSGENSAVSIDCKKAGAMPTDYSYTADSGVVNPIRSEI